MSGHVHLLVLLATVGRGKQHEHYMPFCSIVVRPYSSGCFETLQSTTRPASCQVNMPENIQIGFPVAPTFCNRYMSLSSSKLAASASFIFTVSPRTSLFL